MRYSVKELYLTLQGEGCHAGRPAVFCRFTGCNLWSGREQDRATAICQFCDTDFFGTDGDGGGQFDTARDLADTVVSLWPGEGQPFVVCTGGEPLLQLDTLLIEELRLAGFEIAIETNGTLPVPPGIDWVCVSPKANTDVIVRDGDELKLVFPQDGLSPEMVKDWNFSHFFLQPMDGHEIDDNRSRAVDYCIRHSQWKLSAQIHKFIGIR
jgi:7-carboxy-7-deazaguanine synthase (Cx14CxxC type)